MKLIEVKKDAVVNSSRNEYNPKEWSKRVESYCKYGNVLFYKEDSRENYYVVYSLEDGLRFIQEIGYSSALSSNGFKIASIRNDGEFCTRLFNVGSKVGLAENTKENRKKLATMSAKYGLIFTNNL